MIKLGLGNRDIVSEKFFDFLSDSKRRERFCYVVVCVFIHKLVITSIFPSSQRICLFNNW